MSQSPYCPLCRRVVRAVVTDLPSLLAEGQAEGFCPHSPAERAAAEAAEDAAHQAAIKAKQTPQPKRPGGPL